MPTTLTENLFASKYKDDYQDSHGFHRILFNPRRALQARELIQLQTIIQKEIERFGKSFSTLTNETVKGFLKDSKKSKFKI